jgi:hypothetical protein
MIEREATAVPVEPTNLGIFERICPAHNLTYHGPLGACPECQDSPPVPNAAAHA